MAHLGVNLETTPNNTFFIDLRKGDLKVALSRQKTRNFLINDSTRNISIFTEKGKGSFQKGKFLFNSTDS